MRTGNLSIIVNIILPYLLFSRYTRYEAQLEKTKSTNREAESDFVAEVGGMNHIEPGSEWERVSKHCDFSAKVKRTFDLGSMSTIITSYRPLDIPRMCHA